MVSNVTWLKKNKQEHLKNCVCSGDPPNPGVEPVSPESLHWQVNSLPLMPTGSSCNCGYW